MKRKISLMLICVTDQFFQAADDQGEKDMFKDTTTSRTPWQAFCFVATVSISLATASAALAGDCPADKFKANAHQMVDFKPDGVTDVTLGSIDLGKQPAHIEGRE